MISSILWYSLKYALLIPAYGLASVYGITAISECVHIRLDNMKKKKVWGLLTVFFLSVSLLSWVGHIKSPLDGLLLQVTIATLLGALWSWIFLEFVRAIGYVVMKPKKTQLWVLLSVYIFILYPYICR